MNTKYLSLLAGIAILFIVGYFMFSAWTSTTPETSAVAVTAPELQPLLVDQITEEASAGVSNLVKNGDIPVTVGVDTLNRPDPFAAY